MNRDRATHLSSGFLIAAGRAAETILVDGKFQAALIPAIVCAAFSIEIGLKALIFKESGTEHKREHKLSELFNKLQPSTQSGIAQELNLPLHQLSQKIAEISNAFVEWRYVYEKGAMHIDFSFLKNLAASIEKANSCAG